MSAVYISRIRKDPVSPGDRRVNKKRRIAATKEREANKRRKGCSDIRRAFDVHSCKEAVRLAAACAAWHARKAHMCANVARKNAALAQSR